MVMTRLRAIWCLFGHRWDKRGNRDRVCLRCQREECLIWVCGYPEWVPAYEARWE